MSIKTKEKILKVATALFSQFGYKGTSIRKIASEVGIRESAIYNHYKNKNTIFLEVTKELFSTNYFLDKNISVLALNGKSMLDEFTKNYKIETLNNQDMFRLIMVELMQNDSIKEEFIEQVHKKNIKFLSECFFIMMQENIIKSSDPMLLAYEYLSTLFYIKLQILLTNSKKTNGIFMQFEKHTDFFWESIKV